MGILLTLFAIKYKIIDTDPLLGFVLIIQPAMPTAINMIVLTQLKKNNELQSGILGTFFFFQYICCVFSIITVISISLTALL